MNKENLQGSHKNVWYGLGRQRIEIPKSVFKNNISKNPMMGGLHIKSLGFYPKAKGHLSRRKHGFNDNFIFYCVDGYGFYELDGEKFTVAPSEFFILPQNVEHAYGSSESNPWSIYWVHFGGADLPEFNNQMMVRVHFSPTHIKDNGEIITLFNRMYKSLELGYSTDNLLFANLCLNYFLSLFIYNSRHFPVPENKNLDSVDKAILFMQEKITEVITLKDLSRYCNYSVSRFSNLFKQKTGYAPMDYFMQMKIQQACQLLDFTDRSIKDIAISMGFDDPYYFSKRFKQVIGLPPLRYRAVKKV